MIPVTILTGFLGSGKTTLLNRILTGDHGKRIAVVVNELGDIGLDDRFIARRDDDVVQLTNGCVCCSARNDTMEVLMSLVSKLKEGEKFDHIVIETTGLAKPASLCRFFLGDSPLKAHFELDGVVTVVDAFFGTSQMVQFREVKEQIAVADVVVLNKMDLAEERPLAQLKEWILSLNPTAPVIEASNAEVPLDKILGIGGFKLEGKDSILTPSDHDHGHDSDIVSVSIIEDRPLDRGKFIKWLDELVAMEGGDLLRYKGLLWFAESPERTILQGVHMIRELTPGGPWPSDATPRNELVFIGRRIMADVLTEGVRGAVARSRE
jgi:G3E family GTPase